jgi:uncharacterized protein YneF (UPF0154 family)
MQTKLESFIETSSNVAIGWSVALASQFAIFPLFDIHIPIQDNLLISLYFTVIAVIRGFLVRRYYNNKKTKNKPKKESGEMLKDLFAGVGAEAQKKNQVDPMITAVKKTVDLLNGKKEK